MNIGEQTIVQGGWTIMQELLTMVDYDNDEDQASNPKEVEYEDYGIGDWVVAIICFSTFFYLF